MIRKYTLTAAVLALMMAAATGCGNAQAAENGSTVSLTAEQSGGGGTEDIPQQGREEEVNEEDGTKQEGTENEGVENEGTENEGAENEGTKSNEIESPAAGADEVRNGTAGSNKTGSNEVENSELIFIGGKVRSVSRDSFVLSRTLWEDSADGQGSFVVMPEAGSPEEELVTVRFADSAVFERWTIQGGGADIKKEGASFSEIQEGTGLEAQGFFDGEEFVAEKVIIEIYE